MAKDIWVEFLWPTLYMLQISSIRIGMPGVLSIFIGNCYSLYKPGNIYIDFDINIEITVKELVGLI